MSVLDRATVDTLKAIRASSGFAAFAAILDRKIRSGFAAQAFAMLEAVGAPPAVAWGLIDGWPEEASGLEVGPLVVGRELEASLWLACHLEKPVNAYNWPEALKVAGAAVVERAP